MNPNVAFISSIMGIAVALLVIAFLLFWIAFVKKSPKKDHKK